MRVARSSGSPTLRSPPLRAKTVERSRRRPSTPTIVEESGREALEIKLLGAPEVRVGHDLRSCGTRRKHIELLAILCLHPGELERRFVASRLWPDSSVAAASASLRQATSRLRTLLGPAASRLRSTRETIELDLRLVSVDTAAFDAAVAQHDEHSLARAVDLYAGDLLDGFTSEWLTEPRRLRYEMYLQALEHLGVVLVQRGRADVAEKHLLEVLAREPCNESAARTLMELHAVAGRKSAAQRVYRTLRRQMEEVVGAPPSPATQALHERVERGDVEPGLAVESDQTIFEGTLVCGTDRYPVQLVIPVPGFPRQGLRIELESVPPSGSRRRPR